MNPFHYAFKVKDIMSTRAFYVDILGCSEGRSTDTWIDFDFFGNQLSAHVSDELPELDYCGVVDGINVPIPHFGCILSRSDFETIRRRLEAGEVQFIVKQQQRYEGQIGEQKTMFIFDYSGNPTEFKSFTDNSAIFK